MKLQNIFKVVLVIATLAVSFWSGRYCVNDSELNSALDSNTYISMAYHIRHHGIVSEDKIDSLAPKPTSYREPAYPYFLSFILDDQIMKASDLDYPCKNKPLMLHLRKGQIGVIVVTALVAFLIVFKFTGSFWLSYLAMFLLGFSMEMLQSIHTLMVEQVVIAPAMLLGLFLYMGFEKKNLWYFALAGLILGLMVLTRATYMYMLVFLLPLMYFGLRSLSVKRRVICMAVLTVVYFIPVGGWMIRNKVQVGDFHVTCRAANVMALRVEYNKMNFTEWCGSFLHWTPDQYAKKLMAEWYGADCMTNTNGALVKLNRGYDKGYYLVGKTKGTSVPGVDQKNQRSFALEFVKHPLKHLAVTLPMLWQSIMIGSGAVMIAPCQLEISSPLLLSLAYFLGMLVVFVRSIRKKDWAMLGFVLSGVYLLFMNSFFTHGLTRYSLPILGVEIVCLMICLAWMKKS